LGSSESIKDRRHPVQQGSCLAAFEPRELRLWDGLSRRVMDID
jgi:hypothetical protein